LSIPDEAVLAHRIIDAAHVNIHEGVSACSSFSLPEAFRRRGLGLSTYEVLQQFSGGELTCAQLAEKTGRNVQTIRRALKKLKKVGLAGKAGKLWRGCAIEEIDLDQLAQAVHMKGAAISQRERHHADRLRRHVEWQVKHMSEGAEGTKRTRTKTK